MSARLLVTAFWAFVLLNLAGWTFVRLILRRLQPDANPYIRFRWGSLVVVALAVLIARLLQFEPGIIFGLVAGLAFAITLAASRDAQVILLGSGFALAIALIGWVGYSLLAPVADANPGQLWAVFFSEFFSGITVEGISALPLALLPLFALDGAALFKWKKWVWAVGYVVGLAAFMLVLLTIPAAWGEVPGDFLRWILLYVVFAVVAVAIWGATRSSSAEKTPRPHRPPRARSSPVPGSSAPGSASSRLKPRRSNLRSTACRPGGRRAATGARRRRVRASFDRDIRVASHPGTMRSLSTVPFRFARRPGPSRRRAPARSCARRPCDRRRAVTECASTASGRTRAPRARPSRSRARCGSAR